METREFSADVVVSVMAGVFVCGETKDLYNILNYLTGDNLFTHQLPRAFDECKPWLESRHADLLNSPEVAEVRALSQIENDEQRAVEAKALHSRLIAKYGNIAVSPIPQDEHRHIDPIQEVCDLVGKDRVILVITDD